MTPVLVACLAWVTVADAQTNLVVNPGFEEGMQGWSGMWTRDPDAGKAEVTADRPHEGKACLRIEHTGQQDWSVSQTAPVPCKPGDVFRLGGWLRTDHVSGGDVLICVILRDAASEVLDWAFGAAVTRQVHDWKKLERRSAIPPKGATILFRIIGSGPCLVWADDLVLAKEGNLEDLRAGSKFAGIDLESRELRVHIGPDLGIDVLDKRTDHLWAHWPAASPWIVLSSTKTASGLELKLRDVLSDGELTLKIEVKGSEVNLRMDAPREARLEGEVAFPLPFRPGPATTQWCPTPRA
jgi:Carbohydrate binding domain